MSDYLQEQLPGIDWLDYDETVTLRSYRHFSPVEDEHDNLTQAVASAYWQIEHNSAAPDVLLNARGEVIMDHEALREAIEKFDESAFVLVTVPA